MKANMLTSFCCHSAQGAKTSKTTAAVAAISTNKLFLMPIRFSSIYFLNLFFVTKKCLPGLGSKPGIGNDINSKNIFVNLISTS